MSWPFFKRICDGLQASKQGKSDVYVVIVSDMIRVWYKMLLTSCADALTKLLETLLVAGLALLGKCTIV